MGVADVVIAAVIVTGALYILYSTLWKKKGCCGCEGGDCCKK